MNIIKVHVVYLVLFNVCRYLIHTEVHKKRGGKNSVWLQLLSRTVCNYGKSDDDQDDSMVMIIMILILILIIILIIIITWWLSKRNNNNDDNNEN